MPRPGSGAGEDWPTVRGQNDATFMVGEHDTVKDWVEKYREQIEQSRTVAAAMDLDSTCARTDLIDCNLRYVLFHMLEETARHAGHADIIRVALTVVSGPTATAVAGSTGTGSRQRDLSPSVTAVARTQVGCMSDLRKIRGCKRHSQPRSNCVAVRPAGRLSVTCRMSSSNFRHDEVWGQVAAESIRWWAVEGIRGVWAAGCGSGGVSPGR
ncbi:MAG: hypothetical protein V7637_4969 [Mycobacteriales bacterium]